MKKYYKIYCCDDILTLHTLNNAMTYSSKIHFAQENMS